MPDAVTFKTTPELAAEVLEHACAQGVPMAWIAGDEVYGNAPKVRDAVSGMGKRYVLAVSCRTSACREHPPLEGVVAGTMGRPRKRPRLAEGAAAAEAVAAVIAYQPAESWQRLTVSGGEKGPRAHDWTRIRVVESRDKLPGPESWLLVRGTSLAQSASSHHALDDNSCLAGIHAPSRAKQHQPDPELAELSVPEVRRLLDIALPLPRRSPELRLAWSRWRRGASWAEAGIHRNRSP